MHVSFSRERPRILFVYSSLSPFVRRDLGILEKHFNVKSLKVTTFLVPRKNRTLFAFLTLFKHILWSDIVYSWWADLNALFIVLFCRLLHKRSVIVVGGYETAYLPEIKYGKLLSLPERLEVKFILKNSFYTLAVSRSTEKEILRFTQPRNLKLIYNGVDAEKFKPSGPKENLVMTVVSEISPDTIKIKGLDTFLRASGYLPNVKFILVGGFSDDSIEYLKKIGGSNVEFKGYLYYKALLQYYQKAKVYCQLSAHESFGVSLAEAMSCCCIPVVTKKYALPEIVNNTGFYVPYDDPKTTRDAIENALKSNKGLKARERIKKYFSLEARERRLVEEINYLIGNSS